MFFRLISGLVKNLNINHASNTQSIAPFIILTNLAHQGSSMGSGGNGSGMPTSVFKGPDGY